MVARVALWVCRNSRSRGSKIHRGMPTAPPLSRPFVLATKMAQASGPANLTNQSKGWSRRVSEIAVDYGPKRVQRRLHEISHASQEAGQFGPAVRSEELLGKSCGMWIEQSIALTGTMNDTHIAALLELARKRQQEPIDLADDSKRDTDRE